MKKKTKVEIALLFIAIVWALNFTVIKYSISEIDPFIFNGLRFIFAALLMWIVLFWTGQQFTIPKKDWLPLLGLGLLGEVLYQFLFIYGMDLTFAANAAVMLGTIPIWVALISHLTGIEKMNTYKAIGVAFAFGGIAFIMGGGSQHLSFNAESFIGDLLIVGAAMAMGIYTIVSKDFLTRYTPIQFTTVVITIGAVVLFATAIPGLLKTDWSQVSISALGGIMYSGLLAIGLAFLVWNYGIQTIGAVHTSTFQNLVPVLGVIFGVVILNEQLTLWQYFGSALVIAGIVLSRKKTKNKKIDSS